jgi:hypothetical protein
MFRGRLAHKAKAEGGGVQLVPLQEGGGPRGPALGAMPMDDVPALSKILLAGV